MYYLSLKTIDGWVDRTFTDEVAAHGAYDEAVLLYRYVILSFEETVTTKQTLRDSSKDVL